MFDNLLLLHFRCKHPHCTEIYPWIHQFTNNLKMDDMVASVTFPDVDPGELPEDAKFSMVAGDFLEVLFQFTN